MCCECARGGRGCSARPTVGRGGREVDAVWRASVWVLSVLLSCVSLVSVVVRRRFCGCAERESRDTSQLHATRPRVMLMVMLCLFEVTRCFCRALTAVRSGPANRRKIPRYSLTGQLRLSQFASAPNFAAGNRSGLRSGFVPREERTWVDDKRDESYPARSACATSFPLWRGFGGGRASQRLPRGWGKS